MRAAARGLRTRPRGPAHQVIVLLGGGDYFSNGIHLGVIEASDDPGTESWRNLVAINDLVRDIVQTDSHLVVSALAGDAAAGGVPLALAADRVVAHEDIVLNPYYQHMGGLYGSEYWTYLLPRRVGPHLATRLTSAPFTPLGALRATRIGLLDAMFSADLGFHDQTRRFAERLAGTPVFSSGSNASAAAASTTSASSRSRPTAGKSWPARTSASSAATRATTRRGAGSSTSSTTPPRRPTRLCTRHEGALVRDTLHAPRTPAPGRDVLRGIGAQSGSADHAAARLRVVTRYYEQHVIAWHALGWLSAVRAARDDIAPLPAGAGRAELDQPANPPIEHSAATSRQDARRVVKDTPSDGLHASRPPTVGGLAASRLQKR